MRPKLSTMIMRAAAAGAWRRTVNRGWLKVVSGTHLAEAPYDEP
jgi:hypothetical protein